MLGDPTAEFVPHDPKKALSRRMKPVYTWHTIDRLSQSSQANTCEKAVEHVFLFFCPTRTRKQTLYGSGRITQTVDILRLVQTTLQRPPSKVLSSTGCWHPSFFWVAMAAFILSGTSRMCVEFARVRLADNQTADLPEMHCKRSSARRLSLRPLDELLTTLNSIERR